MASCPKCKKHLHIYNISQTCPHCKTNMRFFGFAENFEKEAKLAELSNARVHVKLKNIKAAFIGSKLTVARLIAMLLPAAGFLLPAARLELLIPFLKYSGAAFDFSLLGLFNFYNQGGIEYAKAMAKASEFSSQFNSLIVAIIAYAIGALLAILVLLLSILCFISYKNMQKLTTIVSGLGILDTFISMLLIGRFIKSASGCVLFSTTGGFGLYLTALLFAVAFTVNLLLWLRGIPVKYDEGMPERVEIYKKIKKGEINIDDLPQPIVETEETRQIEEEIRKQEEQNEKKRKTEKEAEHNA